MTQFGAAVLVAIGVIVTVVHGQTHQVDFKNNCNRDITLFNLQNGPNQPMLTQSLPSGASLTKPMPLGWAGRFWGRYDEMVPFLADLPGTRPDSLFEILFDGYAGLDFYDISLVDGFSVPLSVALIPGTYSQNTANRASCTAISCLTDFLEQCPDDLRLIRNNETVACQSSCTKFGLSEYCCGAQNNIPATCPQNRYGAIFKAACPQAYSYAYDDLTSTYTCSSAPGQHTGYAVQFCRADGSSTTQATVTSSSSSQGTSQGSSSTTAASTSLAPATSGHQVVFQNSCNRSLTLFTLENGPNKPMLTVDLPVGQQIGKIMAPGWAGRFWGRYDDVVQYLADLPGTRPDSLFEILFDGYAGLDFYDISLVDGFSVPLSVAAIAGTYTQNTANPASCTAISCLTDFLTQCPDDLRLIQNGQTVACQSSCTKFGLSEYCCGAQNNIPATCPQNRYGAIFKAACPQAYSYAYDDQTSTFTCSSAPGRYSGYAVGFCGAPPTPNSGSSSTSSAPSSSTKQPSSVSTSKGTTSRPTSSTAKVQTTTAQPTTTSAYPSTTSAYPSTVGHLVSFKNNCKKNLTLFSLENGPGKFALTVKLPMGKAVNKDMAVGWAGRFWGRYDEVVPYLDGLPGTRPDSLFEILFDGYMGLDFYDISLVDGFSVPLKVSLTPGTFTQNYANNASCTPISCLTDFLAQCPTDLQLIKNGKVVACQSSCTKFGKSEYCCGAQNNVPATCPQNKYGAIFKAACPQAYSYAYDDLTSTYTCSSAPGKHSGYSVGFCG